MSSSFGYLIPKKPFDIGQFSKLVRSVLEKEKIINGYYEEEYQWFAAGQNAYSFFTRKADDINPAFEYVEIHDTINNRIIPDCTSENYGAKCNNCKENLDDGLSDELIELSDLESESGRESDMAQLVIECQRCNHANKITEINFDLPVKFNNQFLCFVEIESDFDEEKINDFAKILGSDFEIVYG
jgi:5-methylcytosine-specific restriction endonuclease McrA